MFEDKSRCLFSFSFSDLSRRLYRYWYYCWPTDAVYFLSWTLCPWQVQPCTLGARDFSSAVSGFCQVVASAYGRRRVGLRPTPKIPATREKNLWYPQGNSRVVRSQFLDTFCVTLLINVEADDDRELKQRGRRRLRKRHLKSEFALPQTLSRLFHLV